MNEEKLALFETVPVGRAVTKLAVPSVLGCLVMILYNLADTYFVGLLASPVQSAAVSLAAPALLAFNAVTNLFGTGGSGMMSRCLGRKDYDTAKRVVAYSFWRALACAAVIAVVCTLVKPPLLRLLGATAETETATSEYLFWTVSLGAVPAITNVMLSNMVRGEGNALHASIGVMSGCALNIVLDPFFVLPQYLGMGASGAGCATFLSNCVACGYLLFVIWKQRKITCVCLNPRMAAFRTDIFKEVFGVGVPASIQNLLNVTGTVLLNNLTAGYGADAVSAMGIAHKACMLPMYVSMGITQGVMPLIGYNYSSGNRKRMKDVILCVLRVGAVITVTLAILFYAFSGSLIAAFNRDPGIVAHGRILLRYMSLGIPFLAADFLGVAVYQAIGKGKYSLYFAIARKVLLEIPFILLFDRLYPLYGMGFSQPATELILSVAALFMLRHIFGEGERSGDIG